MRARSSCDQSHFGNAMSGALILMHHDAVSINDPSTVVRVERERTLLIRCGVVVAFVGLALYQLDDNRVMDFLSSAMVFTGALMAFPMAVVQSLEKYRTL